MHNKVIFRYFLVFSLITIIFSWLLITETRNAAKDSRTSKNISTGWTVVFHGKEYQNVDLRSYKFKGINYGDLISISKTIPSTGFKYSSLRFFTAYSAVKVFSGGKQIYSYGLEEYRNKKWLGGGYMTIPLDDLSPNRDITLNITAGQRNAFSVMRDIFIDDYGYSFINFIKGKMFVLICTLFLIMAGIIGLIVCFSFSSARMESILLFQIFLLSFIIGIASFGDSCFIGLYTGKIVLNTYIEYTAFYLIPLLMFFMIPNFIIVTEKERLTMHFIKIFYGIFLIVVFVLHVARIVYISETLWIYQILCALGLVYAFSIAVRKLKNTKTKDYVAVLSLFSMFILFCLDLIRNIITRYDLVYTSIPSFSVLSMDGVIFIISALCGYFYAISDYRIDLNEDFKNEVDCLTGCNTRDNTFQYLDCINSAFKGDKECFYAVITFYLRDFDDLQQQFGPQKAEQILVDFSKEIEKIFSYYGKIGRIGVSRFIVVAPCILKKKAKVLINLFDGNIKRYCRKNEINLKYSSSSAFNYELDTMLDAGPMEVYRLSEARLHSLDFDTEKKSK